MDAHVLKGHGFSHVAAVSYQGMTLVMPQCAIKDLGALAPAVEAPRFSVVNRVLKSARASALACVAVSCMGRNGIRAQEGSEKNLSVSS